MKKFSIHSDIRKAHTLPARFYRDPLLFEHGREWYFTPAWQYLTDTAGMDQPGRVRPVSLLPGFLDEPLLLSCDGEGKLHLLSNVCTHRGKILVEEEGCPRVLSCGYHGRCFYHDGRFRSMPGFKKAEDFPGPADHLTRIPFATRWGMVFAALRPFADFESVAGPMIRRLQWLPWDTLRFDPGQSKDFELNAHWALYVDNYLEGFHIPWVHPALDQALDLQNYAYETYPYCNLQLGIAGEGQPAFDPPEGHPDHGRRIYAYYFWLFPNLMFNVYPWGLSLNVVEPRSPQRTRVRFRTYLFENAGRQEREMTRIDETEYEDEAVVESVQKGLQSRYYERGRFSPEFEPCVHHFHQLLARFSEPPNGRLSSSDK